LIVISSTFTVSILEGIITQFTCQKTSGFFPAYQELFKNFKNLQLAGKGRHSKKATSFMDMLPVIYSLSVKLFQTL